MRSPNCDILLFGKGAMFTEGTKGYAISKVCYHRNPKGNRRVLKFEAQRLLLDLNKKKMRGGFHGVIL